MKYLGIDYGTKRIGLALSDADGTLAFPHSTIPSGEQALGDIVALINQQEVEKIVIGESRDFAGAPNAVQTVIEQFKKDLGALTQLQIVYEPEVMTSALAARQFTPSASPSGVDHPRASRKANPSHKNLDAAAAALILQSYLDKLQNNGSN